MADRCIYCPTETTGDEGRAHVVPEAIFENDLTLPDGACCEDCNNYLGKLDSALISHPLISMYAQFLGLPGKGGAERKELGNVSRDPDGSFILIPAKKPTEKITPSGVRQVTVRPRIAPAYDSVEFARGVHRIAFESVAAAMGPDEALREQYDEVRDFVRRPDRNEQWPYVTWTPGLSPIEKGVEIISTSDGPGHCVGVRIFNLRFVVDLLRSGELEEYADEELPDSAHYGFPDAEPEAPEEERYRMRIWLDEEAARKDWKKNQEKWSLK